MHELKNRVCMVTGASRGIGRETALALARQGADVVLVCRDRQRGEAVLEEVRGVQGGGKIELLLGDLSLQSDIRRIVREFRETHDRLHVLVNNAGAILMKRDVTKDGIEATFATNHVAYFLLTDLLLDVLKASAPARVVTVASGAHRQGKIHFDDLNLERGFGGMKAYAQSKLANVMFTFALSRRLVGTGVTANTLHPGVIGSSFLRNNGKFFSALMTAVTPFLASEKDGAKTSIYLASSPEVEA